MMLAKTKISFGLSVVFLLVSIGALVSTILLITKKSDELKLQVATIADSSAQIEEFNKLSALLNRTEEDRNYLKLFVLGEDKIINFLSDIERISRSFGLEFKTNSLDTIKDEKGLNVFSLDFSFIGGKDQALVFLEFLETLPYASRINTYYFTVNNNGGREVINGTVQLFVYIKSYE